MPTNFHPPVINYCERTCEILSKTHDGQDLAPKHMALIQLVVNGDASDFGLLEFNKLYEQVEAGTYCKSKVFFYGVEHITKDHEGYIYYKGHHIDHFSYRDNYREEHIATIRAAQKCARLEAKGHPINSITYCWRDEEYLTPEEIAEAEIVLELDDVNLVGVDEFIKVNSAPDVQQISQDDILKIKGLGVNQTATLGGGAGAVTSVRRIA